MSEHKSVEAVEKVLGTPIAGDFPENALKVRRNLLIFSSISIFVEINGLKVGADSTILGLKLTGLNDDHLRGGLFVITAYLLFHFLWYVCEAFPEWRLRITGTRLSYITGAKFVSDEEDFPKDPRQSTLHSWWTERAAHIGSIKSRLTTICKKIPSLEVLLREAINNQAGGHTFQRAFAAIQDMKASIEALTMSIDQVEKTFTSQRIPVSLKRFDNWFGYFLRIQNLRWLVIDVLLPVSWGAYALYLLLAYQP